MLPSELIADEKNWTKRTNARNAKGDPVRIESKEAVSFCMVGAIVICCDKISSEKLNKIEEKVRMSITDFNDNATHSEVIKALKSVGL